MKTMNAIITKPDARRTIRRVTRIGLLSVFLAVSSALAQTTTTEGGWKRFASDLETSSAAGSSAVEFELNRSGGTSVYMRIVQNGRPIGAVLPENSATSISGEFASYQLARLLGFPELSQPAELFQIRGDLLRKFERMLAGASFSGQKEANRKQVLARIKANPGGLAAVCKQWMPQKPIAIDSLVTGGSPNGKLNTAHSLAKALLRTQPQPSSAGITLKELKVAAPASTLARQLSNILVVDALAGQWDRFSGGNLQAYADEKGVRLVALDNGGATLAGASSYHTLTKGWVTRFDPPTAEALVQLNEFLQGQRPQYQGHTEPGSLLAEIGVPSASQKRFLARMADFTAHVKQCIAQHGGVFSRN